MVPDSGVGALSSLRIVENRLWPTDVPGEMAADLRTQILPFTKDPVSIGEGDEWRDTG